MSERTGWDRRLSVVADGKGLVGHAGVVLLHQVADRVGLTAALAQLWPPGRSANWHARAHVLLGLASAIVLGAVNLSEAEQLQAHHQAVFGPAASDSTTHRLLGGLDERARGRIAKASALVRRRVWGLLALRPGGFPWLTVAGKVLTGWIVIDIDATIITASSRKEGAAATFKKTFGFHPLAARGGSNTQESLAVLLRPGNAGSNTVADHLAVFADALTQIPGSSRAKILVRVDGAGASHELLEHLEKLNTARRTVRYMTGWTIITDDEHAIAKLPEQAWDALLEQDGTPHDAYGVAELTGLNHRPGWPEGMRLLVRRVRPSGRQLKKLTTLEKKTGWKYSIVATNIRRMWGIAGSHRSGSMPWPVPTRPSRTACAVTRRWACATCRPRSCRSTRAGYSPRRSATTWTAGSASSPCTTRTTWCGPSPTPCGSGSTTSPPASRPTPDGGGYGSNAPGPGPTRSPWPGSG
ncbi:hypothetical protein GCM10022295_90230 [Streptomyces osmaniensis]|uniref:Transposase DDE domain-containing protein n=1 Tax=Streptomyces osmaniensis TaxID=593134 RepID=A0ABP6Z2E7_9ACTN